MSLQERLLKVVSGRTGAPGGFMDRYIRWACGQTDAPPNAHVLSALMGIASVASVNSRVRFGTHNLVPNLFTLNVGASGRVRKTWSQSMMRRLLERVAPDRLGETAGSYEAMIDELKDRPYCTIFEDEFTTVLAGATGDGPGSKLKSGFTKLYDCNPVSNRTRKIGKVTVQRYRLNLAGAISPSYLSENTSPEDYTGGFLSRWLFAYGERPAGQFLGVFDVVPDLDEEQAIEDMLMRLKRHAPGGTWEFDDAALALFRPWEQEVESQSTMAQERIQGFLSRESGLAVRIACLIAMDRLVNVQGHEETGPMDLFGDQKRRWVVSADDFAIAAEIVRCHLEDVQRVVETIEHTREAKVKARVLAATPLSGWVSLSHITEGAGMTLRTIRDPLDTLVMEGRVQRVERPGGQAMFRRTMTPTTGGQVEGTPLQTADLPIGHHMNAPVQGLPGAMPMVRAIPAPNQPPISASPSPAPARVSITVDEDDRWLRTTPPQPDDE